jgi:hypothetical protein
MSNSMAADICNDLNIQKKQITIAGYTYTEYRALLSNPPHPDIIGAQLRDLFMSTYVL